MRNSHEHGSNRLLDSQTLRQTGKQFYMLNSTVRQYFEAWNSGDVHAVVDTFNAAGSYFDPTVPQGVSGSALFALVQGFLRAFPDVTFEVVQAVDNGAGVVATRWLMRGTNTGVLGDLQPTRRFVSLPGADFFQISRDRISSVHGYYDVRTLNSQLGLPS